MKLRASLSVEMEIDRNIIIRYAECWDNNAEITENSTDFEIQDYLQKHYKDILAFTRQDLIDWFNECCDDISLRGKYELVKIEEIV